MRTLVGLVVLIVAAEVIYRFFFGAWFTPGQVVDWIDGANEKSRPYREEIKRDWDQRQQERERQLVGERMSISLQDCTIRILAPVSKVS